MDPLLAVLKAVMALAFLISTVNAAQGFKVDLIRRDSPKSPFYNQSKTSYGRLGHAVQRSLARANRMSVIRQTALAGLVKEVNNVAAAHHDIQKAQLVGDDGEYLMDVLIGTPPVRILAVADTGSDLLWTQCKPCKDCYRQSAPLFDPSKSSTYTTVSCQSKACTSHQLGGKCTGKQTGKAICRYDAQYGDGSYTNGVLATDKIALGASSASGKALSLPKAVFGCGFNNAGTFSANSSGIVGLGRGDWSLVLQMKSQIGGKFSYCLLPIDDKEHASKMNFGDEAEVSGVGTVTTHAVSGTPETFYFLTLEYFSVGNKKTKVPFIGESEEGNIIIDSGTTLTILPANVYQQLESAVREQVEAGQRVKDPQGALELCYRSTSDQDFAAPVIRAHFTGADVELNRVNTFVRTSEDVICLAFGSTSEAWGIFGNLAQMNFLVGYDLNAGTVSFKPADCSKL